MLLMGSIGDMNRLGWFNMFVDLTVYCNNGRPQRTSWVNATSLMRELPSEVDLSETPYVLYTAMDSNRYNAASVVIPNCQS